LSNPCCGSAGIYNLLQPELAGQLLDRKLDEILSVDPQRVTTANPGCLMQIRFGLKSSGASIPVQHPVELLYESVRSIPA
jgi:glycolate oxidase iron-sulfur subunit